MTGPRLNNPVALFRVFVVACVSIILLNSCGSKDPVTPTPEPPKLTWQPMSSGTTKEFLGITGRSASDVLAFGGGTGPIVRRFNGTGWSIETMGGACELAGGWSAPSTSFLVGRGCVMSFDGSTWSDMSPDTFLDNNYVSIWGFSGNGLFVASSGGYIQKWNGVDWSMEWISGNSLNDIWGSSPTDVFAVGGAATSARVYRFDGADWASMASARAYSKALYGVWGFSTNDVYAVGTGGIILRFDGNVWAFETSGTQANLSAVWGSAPNNIFAVGDGGVVLHFDGKEWTTMDSKTTSDLRDVWGSSGSNVFAVGKDGIIIRYAPE